MTHWLLSAIFIILSAAMFAAAWRAESVFDELFYWACFLLNGVIAGVEMGRAFRGE